MNTNSKYFIPGFAAVVFLIVAAILLITGGGVPKNAVASVKGESITQARFDQVLRLFSAQNQPGSKGKPVLPDPPEFTNCIANKKKTAPKKSVTKDLKDQCQNEWDTARQQIMTTLIQAKWYELEADARGIEVSDKDVRARFDPLKKQTFPKEEQYKKFLIASGQTEQDLLGLIRNQLYQEKIREAVTKKQKITPADLKGYFNSNKEKFVKPPTRDLVVVFNEKKGRAQAAKDALDSGDSWAVVAKKYSGDSATKDSGGKFPGVTKGQFEPALDKAVFNAKKGQVIGPIKTQFGYYVFAVEKANAEKAQTLKEAEPTIRQAIEAEVQQKSFDTFQKEFTAKWRKKTKCDELYAIELCKNGPDKAPVPAAPGGGAAQGGGSPPPSP